MAELRPRGPYIWVTWLTRLLAGENACEWAAWFKAQHTGRSWQKARGTFEQANRQVEHTAQLNSYRQRLEDQGFTVWTENQNSFVLNGRSASIGGKPDLIATNGADAFVVDIKTGNPSTSHMVQVMLYQYMVPKALKQYKGALFNGRVAYPDHEIEIPASAVDERFVGHVTELVRRLAAGTPTRRVPSYQECRFCDITSADCPDRMFERSTC